VAPQETEIRLKLGSHSIAVRRDAANKIWIEQCDADRTWRSPLRGLIGVYRTDPRTGPPHWALGGLVGAEQGVPAGVVGAVVWSEGREVGRSKIHQHSWLVGLAPEAARWKPAVLFLKADGSRWGSVFQFPRPLEDALGSERDQSPDGSGWSSYAPMR
jgi:hypothetical protein